MALVEQIKAGTLVYPELTTASRTVIGYFQTIPTEVRYFMTNGVLTYVVVRGNIHNSFQRQAFEEVARKAMESKKAH